MFDLFGAYLLIIILVLVGNIGLFFADLKLTKIKYMLTSIILSIIIFVLTFFSNIFKANLSFLSDNLGWLFIITAIVIIMINYIYSKHNLKISIILTTFVLLVLTFLISSQFENFDLFQSVLYFVVSLILFLVLRSISDLLHYAKREYYVIVGEFMALEAILIFIFGLTFWSIMSLNYDMFSSFLILTPTYQLIYVIIGMILVMIIGLYYNDIKLKKR